MKKFKTLLLILAATASLYGQPGKTYYVSPGGSDNNPGSAEKPFLTLIAARDAARESKGSNTIIITPGEYYLTTSLELDARDNGLTIKCEPAGSAILYGGTPVKEWKRENDRFWSSDLEDVKEGKWDFRAIVVNGRLPERSRYPSTGTLTHTQSWDVKVLPAIAGYWERQPLPEEKLIMSYKPEDIPPSLDIRNAEIRVYHMWNESLVGISRNDVASHKLVFSTPATYPPGAFGVKKYIIWNTIEGMTNPGRWYLDRTRGKLVYWPLEGEDILKSKIIAPRMESIIRISGTPGNRASGITISGIKLEATTIPLRSAGFGGNAFDGAITMSNAEKCIVRDVEISNTGGTGISATDVNECLFENSRIHNTGACLVKVTGKGNGIEDNDLHHAGVHYPSSAGIYVGGSNNRVCRNQVHDIPYSGMILGKSDLLVEDNLIYRVMLEVHDGAAIYASSAFNVIMRGNVVRDISQAGEGYGVSAYYFDEGAYNNVLENNVSINVGRPVHNHIARNTVIRNNCFINSDDIVLSFQSSAKFRFEGNTVITPGNIRVVSPNALTSWQNNKIITGGVKGDNAPAPYKVDSIMPLFTAPSPKNRPVEVRITSKSPVHDGVLGNEEWPGDFYRLDREISRMPYSGAPVLVKFSRDNKNLYIGALVAMFDVNNISQGSEWKKNDGIEISLRGSAKGTPVIYVLRGYVNGTLQSVTVAGTGEKTAEQFGKSVSYHARIMEKPGKGWVAEWTIPLGAAGIKPLEDLKIPFNICAYINEYDNWHCWEGTLGETWEVDKAGVMIFR